MARHLRSTFAVMAAALILFGTTSNAQDYGDDDYGGDGDGDYGDGDGDGDGDYGDGDGDGDGDGGGELHELKSVSDFDAFIDNADASLIGAFTAEKMPDPKSKRPHDWDDEEDGEWEPPTIDNPGLVSLKSIASSEYGSRFAYTTVPEVLEKLKFKPGTWQAGLYLYRSPWYVSKEHDRARERFPSDTFTHEGVSHFIATKAQPLVGEFNSDTQDRYTSPVLLIFMDLDHKENLKSVNYVLKRARKVAASHTGKLAFAVASFSSMSYELDDYGLAKMKSSEIRMAIRAGSDSMAKKYSAPVDKSFSGDTLSAFAKAYLAGELTPYEAPESKDDDSADLGAGKDEM